MSLFLGNIGDHLLRRTISSPRINNIANCVGRIIRKIDPTYQIGLTREAYLLSRTLGQGDRIVINKGSILVNDVVTQTQFLNKEYSIREFEITNNLLRAGNLADYLRFGALSCSAIGSQHRFNSVNLISSLVLASGFLGLTDVIAKSNPVLRHSLSFLYGHLGDFAYPTFYAGIWALMNSSKSSGSMQKHFTGATILMVLSNEVYEIKSAVMKPIHGSDFDNFGVAAQVRVACTFDWWDMASYLMGGLLGIYLVRNLIDYSDFNKPSSQFNQSLPGRLFGSITSIF